MRARNSDNGYKPLATHPSRVFRFVSLYRREFKPDRHTAFCVHALHCTQLVCRHTRVHKQDPTAIRSVRLEECVGWLRFVPGDCDWVFDFEYVLFALVFTTHSDCDVIECVAHSQTRRALAGLVYLSLSLSFFDDISGTLFEITIKQTAWLCLLMREYGNYT